MLKGNSNNRGHHGEPLATSYHKKFLGTVDYLWYASKYFLIQYDAIAQKYSMTQNKIK
jgi:mRNA deadenylase 3'-5' endonuclease subunit Ccr4